MTTTKCRPILFSGPMVRAILDGRKTQTRRAIKPQPAYGCRYEINGAATAALHLSGEWGNNANPIRFVPPMPRSLDHRLPCPYGALGDRLWVRETWFLAGTGCVFYRADGVELAEDCAWRPSIHMPSQYSRLTLEITGVRVERLNDISEDDAKAEGAIGYAMSLNGRAYDRFEANWCRYSKQIDAYAKAATARGAFAALWETIHGPGSWAANPWVWVIEFARTEGG